MITNQIQEPVVEETRGEFTISTDPDRLDPVAIHAYLTRSYWSPGVPMSIVQRAIAGSLCFGVYKGTEQIGFARAITDRATFAYFADIFILDAYQKKGLGKWLMKVITSHPSLQGLRRYVLTTLDAHGLYTQFGFQQARPNRYMEINHPDIYQPKHTE